MIYMFRMYYILDYICLSQIRSFICKSFILSSNDVTKLFLPYTGVQFKAEPTHRLHINNVYYILTAS
jgi:hypothetical protein